MEILCKLLLIEAVLFALAVVVYFGAEVAQKSRFHNVWRAIDAKIPLRPGAVFVYLLWFPLMALFPVALYLASSFDYVAYQAAIIICAVLSVACYLIYPTTFRREPPPAGFSGRVLALVYRASYKGVNCAPSMHCSMSYLAAAVACGGAGLPLWGRALVVVVALGIVASTLFTKQHVVLDVITALPVAAVALVCGYLVASARAEPILSVLGL